MPESQMKPSIAVLFLYLAVFSGALVLFAGYLSKYTPFLMVAALYVLFAFRYLRRNEGLADPLILLVIACFFHVFGFLLLPSGIYLLVHRSRGGAPDGHKRIVSSLIIATALAAIILPMSSRFAIYYLPIVGNAETDGIISLGHIADVMNLLLLALPALPLLLSVPAINRSLTKDAGRPEAGAAGKKAVSRESGLSSQGADADSKDAIAAWRIHAAAEMSFAVLLFIPWLLFLILLRPQVSVARDWDRYTLALLGFFPLMIVGLKTILRLVPRPDRQAESGVGTDLPAKPLMPNGLASVVSPAVVITLVMSLAWLGINRSPEMSTLRFENLLAFEKASAVQGYGQLAFYHSSRGNIVKAIAASEKACAIDPSPDNVYTESLLYLTAEDTLHAIDLLEQSIKDHPDAHRNRQMLVTLFNSMERYADLTRVCKEGIKQEPDEPQYYYFLGKSYLYRGNLREGVIALMKCKQMNPPQSVLDNVDFLLSHIKEKEQ
jgi:tetratricopeptide (TPR) repeat protein